MGMLDDEKNTAARKIFDSLPVAEDGADDWSTSAAVADAVGLSKSTVNAILAKLVAENAVEVHDQGRGKQKLYRAPKLLDGAGSDDDPPAVAEPVEVAEPAPPVEVVPADDPGEPHVILDVAAVPAVEAQPAAPGGVLSVLAGMRAAAPQAAAAIAAGAPQPDAPVRVAKSCTRCGGALRRRGRVLEHVDSEQDTSHKATTAKQRERVERAPRERKPAPERVPATRKDGSERFRGDPSTFRKRGELAGQVLGYLASMFVVDPNATYSAAQIAKEIDAQPGAVQYALTAHVRDGNAELAQEAPKRYRAKAAA